MSPAISAILPRLRYLSVANTLAQVYLHYPDPIDGCFTHNLYPLLIFLMLRQK